MDVLVGKESGVDGVPAILRMALVCRRRGAFSLFRLATVGAMVALTPLAIAQRSSRGPKAPTTTQESGPAEAAWVELQKLTVHVPTKGDYRTHVAGLLRRNESLLRKIRAYMSVYPGGAHRDEAVRLELATMFEIGTLRGGDYRDLRHSVSAYLERPPCDAALEEAAYWSLICERLDGGANPATSDTPASQEANSPADAALAYASRYPRSRFTPHLLSGAFESARRRQDRHTMREIVERLRAEAPQHFATQLLTAELHRVECVGAPLELDFTTSSGRRVTSRDFAGHMLIVVVWESSDTASRSCVEEVEATRRASPELRVVGVNLDLSRSDMETAIAEMGVDWPQLHDERGPAGEFAVTWGIRRAPVLLAAGPNGRLIGVAGEPEWRDLLRRVVDN